MLASLAADVVVVIHLGFILFVVFGGLLALRWPATACVHLPAMTWGAYVEFAGSICPLTPLEQALREHAGEQGYSGGFVEHYVIPLIYPENLTASIGLVLGTLVLAVNALVYGWVLRQRYRGRRWPFGNRMR